MGRRATFLLMNWCIWVKTAPICLFYMFYAALVTLWYKHSSYPSFLVVPTYLVATLTGVLGTLLAFRVNQSYDRFYDARKQWSTFQNTLRNMSRQVSLHFPTDKPRQAAHTLAAFKLFISFPVAVKHELRGEHGFDYDDLKQIESTLTARKSCNVQTKWRTKRSPFTPLSSVSTITRGLSVSSRATTVSTASTAISSTSSVTVTEQTSLLHAIPSRSNTFSSFLSKYINPPALPPTHFSDHRCNCLNIPLAIIDQLAILFAAKARAEEIPGPVSVTLQSQLNTLVEAYTNQERILSTKIPLAYGLHLRQVMMLYCLFLPFQVMEALKWYTVILLAVVTFTIFGIENLGLQIENPFGYDPNDLPLDRFCDTIRAEIEDYMFNPLTLDAYTPVRFDASAFLRSIDDELLESAYADLAAEAAADSAEQAAAAASSAVPQPGSAAHSFLPFLFLGWRPLGHFAFHLWFTEIQQSS
ncbi:Bestrophin, RFP-TM, chloride channel-domain-containing protein [Zopfochytrium polystomum]|nr:Bestrophin, RFP-TM, chloride channel-domain-containing protein [Zopfochytrium polystomum]